MKRQLVAGLALLAATGCSSLQNANQANPAPCPNVFALNDASKMVEFAGDPALDNVAWSAEIVDVRSSCRYFEEEPIKALVEIDFAVGRGPAATSDVKDINYFVAVTRTNRALITKEEFAVPVRIRDNIATATFTEELSDILIARKGANTSGTNFEIAVGFVLTREQLLYNRSGKSLKFNIL